MYIETLIKESEQISNLVQLYLLHLHTFITRDSINSLGCNILASL